MLSRGAKTSSLVPSRNALRVLRQLALAGSTVGGFCTVAALTYEAHRRVRIAETIIENKRTLHSTAPNYNAQSSAQRLRVMVEAAEAGEFMGIESLKTKRRNASNGPSEPRFEAEMFSPNDKPKSLISLHEHHYQTRRAALGRNPRPQFKYKDVFDSQKVARNAEILASEKQQAEIARQSGDLSFDDEIRRLLNEGEEIRAANMFLSYSWQARVISWERRELACFIFTANCIKGNIFVARSLFNCMHKVSVVSNEMWATLMHLLAKEGHIDSVGVLYEKFSDTFTVPKHLLEVILRCLIESKRIDAAKSLLFERFGDAPDCGLCGAYLDGLWKKSKSIELLSSQFNFMLQRLKSLDMKPTEKLFNPMVKIMVETGRGEQAEALVQAMSTQYGCQPGCRTIGQIIYSRALNCDWDGVMDGLRAMHQHGFTAWKRDFAIVFDRVFLEYYPTHTGEQILDFVTTCINDFDIRPDKVLHRHILEAIIEKGTMDMLAVIEDMATRQCWNTGFHDDFIKQLVMSRKLAMSNNPVGIWQLKQAAKHRQSHIASTRRILGSSSDDWAVRGEKIALIHRPAEETFPQTVNEMVTSKNSNFYVPLQKRMEHLISMARPTEALAMFAESTKGGYIVRPIHLTLAVIASLLSFKPTALKTARHFIASEREYWKNFHSLRHSKLYTPWTPIFFQRVMKVDPQAIGRGGLIKMAMFEYYHLCATHNEFAVKHVCASSYSHSLIKNQEPELAVDLLTALYQSRWRLSHGFDQVLLKMLLRAFANLNNLKGVWWCIMTVISREEPIHQQFTVEAISQVDALHIKSKSSTSPHLSEQLSILQELLSVLHHKSQGDSYWSAVSVQPEWKKLRRSHPFTPAAKHHLPPTTDLKDLIMNFDEEMELDELLKRKEFDAPDRVRLWDETNMAELHSGLPEDPDYPWYEPETWDNYYVPETFTEHEVQYSLREFGAKGIRA